MMDQLFLQLDVFIFNHYYNYMLCNLVCSMHMFTKWVYCTPGKDIKLYMAVDERTCLTIQENERNHKRELEDYFSGD